MIQDLLLGAVGLVAAWLFLYSAVLVGVKHALRDHFGERDGEPPSGRSYSASR